MTQDRFNIVPLCASVKIYTPSPNQIPGYDTGSGMLSLMHVFLQTVELADPKQHHVTPVRPIRIGSADQLSSVDSTQPEIGPMNEDRCPEWSGFCLP